MPGTKRQRYDWANKVDPETGAKSRFCTQCETFLAIDLFLPSHVKNGQLMCKTHFYEHRKESHRRATNKRRGGPHSVERLRTNTNLWLRRQSPNTPKWTDGDVKKALQHHNVALSAEPRCVQLRPRDPALPFSVENSVVKYRLSRSGGQTKQSSE